MNKKRVMAGVLTCAVVMGNTGVMALRVSASDVKNSKKEEVIYVITDAQGTVQTVDAVNIFGKGTVTDFGDYSSVKMLNSTETIQMEDGKVTFTTDLNKVYYQGTMENAQLPWNIEISYTLDGKSITPEELAGKSGALKIHIKITQNEECTSNFYDNYALQASLSLDTERCDNICADGATLANVGSDKQISYTVLPGKGLDAEVTADVVDFEMDAVEINGIRLNLNIEIDDAELMDKVNEIMDAAKDINDGATELSDGTGDLLSGSSDLCDGTDTLYDGTSTLKDGASSLKDGIDEMQTALDTLNAQSSTLTDGSAEVLTALTTIQSSLSDVSMSAEDLETLTESSATIKKGITNAYKGAKQLSASLSYDSYAAAMKEGGLDLEQLQTANTNTIGTLSAQIEELSKSLEMIKSIPGYDKDATYAAQAAQLEAQINSLSQMVTLLGANNAALGGTSQYFDTVSTGAQSLVDGLAELKTSYATFDKAIGDLVDSLSDLTVNLSSLKTGIDSLVESYTTLDTGIGDYTDSVASIVTAYTKIVDGAASLLDGTKALYDGAESLKQGTSDLYDGIVTLNDGAVELSDGTKEFYEKTDGMDSKIEDQIDEMLDSITGGDSEVVSFVSDKNEDVTSVQFVIKTSAIEKEDVVETVVEETQKQNFWQKLLQLFGF